MNLTWAVMSGGWLGADALASVVPASSRLFIIERSTNANLVCYDANLTKEGALDPVKPVTAYWVMNAQDGHREDLTRLEQRVAYGFTIDRDSGGNWVLTSKALGSQPLLITVSESGEPRAETEINGHRIWLKKIFVQTAGGLFPHVDSLKVSGTDVTTGALVEELLHP
jgi:hypothetical protein